MSKPYKGCIEAWQLKALRAVNRDGIRIGRVLVVYGVLGDGYIRTSPVVTLTKHVVETENSIYSLGEMAAP